VEEDDGRLLLLPFHPTRQRRRPASAVRTRCAGSRARRGCRRPPPFGSRVLRQISETPLETTVQDRDGSQSNRRISASGHRTTAGVDKSTPPPAALLDRCEYPLPAAVVSARGRPAEEVEGSPKPGRRDARIARPRLALVSACDGIDPWRPGRGRHRLGYIALPPSSLQDPFNSLEAGRRPSQ